MRKTPTEGVFNLHQHFEISYSRYANKHYITGVYITINDSLQVTKFGNAGLKSEIYYKKKISKKQSKNIRISMLKFNNLNKNN